MELPKNITQIGEANQRCKIYVEDYVISYMKQLNQVAQDKDMAVALYGVKKEENEVSYLFLYGACKLTFLQKETRHLSQAQQQEIEKLRVKYFSEYSFLGYRLLNGDMIEGMHVCEQGICRYISGYAQFYEKNDSMLAYMLDAREEAKPEVVDQQKYETVKRRQEERRQQHEETKYSGVDSIEKTTVQKAPGSSNSLRGMRVAVVAVFALLCVIGLTSMNGEGKLDDLQVMARQVMEGALQQTQENAESVTESMASENNDGGTLVAEDKLAEAILQENEAVLQVQQVSTPGIVAKPPETEETVMPETEPAITETATTDIAVETAVMETDVTEAVPTQEVETIAEITPPQPGSYIIKDGDTLIGISVANYGSDTRVSEICALNQIENPDDIKVGQKILLP
uniref:LysM peptidoglycan-binding domain-containing protein n=1 Tax=Acetatifactor sp. TaxID=1872090 RepID=UPI0040560580